MAGWPKLNARSCPALLGGGRPASTPWPPGDQAGSLIEIGALRALGLAASGDADRAVDALAEALTLACPRGYVRVFADEGRRWPRCWPG